MITVELNDEERQVVLLALAKLSVERPGWDDLLNGVALKMDNPTAKNRAESYDRFCRIYGTTAWHKILDNIKDNS